MKNLTAFIEERYQMFVRRHIFGDNPPWTDDKILQTYKFCNVNREHDTVTRWVRYHTKNIKDMNALVYYTVMARVFNEPEALELIFDETLTHQDRVDTLDRHHGRMFRGAYMMPVHGTQGTGTKGHHYWLSNIYSITTTDWTQKRTLKSISDGVQASRGFGPFVANQVCADLRYHRLTEDFVDRYTYVDFGPGTKRGLSIHYGRKIRADQEHAHFWSAMAAVRKELPHLDSIFKDPNNLSNCFCEFDKYVRGWEGKKGLRKYA